MTPNPYQSAYEKALAELTAIAGKMEQMRTRKGHVENLIKTLQSVFESNSDQMAVSTTMEAAQHGSPQENPALTAEAASEAETESGYSYMEVPSPLPEGHGDPFERRVKTTFRFKGLTTQRS